MEEGKTLSEGMEEDRTLSKGIEEGELLELKKPCLLLSYFVLSSVEIKKKHSGDIYSNMNCKIPSIWYQVRGGIDSKQHDTKEKKKSELNELSSWNWQGKSTALW